MYRIEELTKKIIDRPKNVNLLQECLAIAEIYNIYRKLNQIKPPGFNRFSYRNRDDVGSCLFSNETLASLCNLRIRNIQIRKTIGNNIDRTLINTITSYPELNKIKFLYPLSKKPKEVQREIVKRAVAILNERP